MANFKLHVSLKSHNLSIYSWLMFWIRSNITVNYDRTYIISWWLNQPQHLNATSPSHLETTGRRTTTFRLKLMQFYLQPADGVGLVQPAGYQQKGYQKPHLPTHVPPSVGPLHAPNIVAMHNIHCGYMKTSCSSSSVSFAIARTVVDLRILWSHFKSHIGVSSKVTLSMLDTLMTNSQHELYLSVRLKANL
jgi:hypothetical protein